MRSIFVIILISFLSLSFVACKFFGSSDQNISSNQATLVAPNQIRLTPEQLKSPLINFTTMTPQTLDMYVDVLGIIASDTEHVLQVHPLSSGKVKEVLVSVGDVVKKGASLMRYNTGASVLELKAPENGMILGIYSETGDFMDPGIPVLTIADVSTMRCIFDVFEKEIGKIKKGEPVDVLVEAFPKKIFHGNITYISPRVNENSRTVKVGADIENPNSELKFGMFVTGRIKVDSVRALAVPESSIQTIDGKTFVFVRINENTLEVRPIKMGVKVGGLVEVKNLKEGEIIVNKGSFILKNILTKT